jgi:glycerophosphoryl diester phosphodiesterase
MGKKFGRIYFLNEFLKFLYLFSVFVAMHDLLLDDTTNVATLPQYADRKTTKIVDGVNTTGYFISDFSYTELQDLRLIQRLPQRTTLFNNVFTIPSFDQIMSLAQTSYTKTGRTVGIYPELKHPSFFKELGFAMEDMLLTALKQGGYLVDGPDVPNDLQMVLPVVIQCFEANSLQYLRTKTSIPLILLLDTIAPSNWTESTFQAIAQYAHGFGPDKTFLGSVSYYHAKEQMTIVRSSGLKIHPWTFRADQGIELKFQNDFNLEQSYFYCCLGMDAIFSEFPDRTRETLDMLSNYTQWQTATATTTTTTSSTCPLDCTAY